MPNLIKKFFLFGTSFLVFGFFGSFEGRSQTSLHQQIVLKQVLSVSSPRQEEWVLRDGRKWDSENDFLIEKLLRTAFKNKGVVLTQERNGWVYLMACHSRSLQTQYQPLSICSMAIFSKMEKEPGNILSGMFVMDPQEENLFSGKAGNNIFNYLSSYWKPKNQSSEDFLREIQDRLNQNRESFQERINSWDLSDLSSCLVQELRHLEDSFEDPRWIRELSQEESSPWVARQFGTSNGERQPQKRSYPTRVGEVRS